jgi:hypothetical protein
MAGGARLSRMSATRPPGGTPVAPITILVGLLLIALGTASYVGTGSTHVTALIPAFFGLALAALGALAYKESIRKHVMHAAVLIGLIGFLGGAGMALPKLPTLLSTGRVERADGTDASRAVWSQTAMGVVCGVFVGLCVNSFIQARRRRAASGDSPSKPAAV